MKMYALTRKNIDESFDQISKDIQLMEAAQVVATYMSNMADLISKMGKNNFDDLK